MGTTFTDKDWLGLAELIVGTKQRIMTIGSDIGLNGMQAISLLLLHETRGISMQSLTKRFDCDASNMTGIIDGLERKGLVKREAAPDDGRRRLISLSASGEQLRAVIVHRLNEDEAVIFSGLNPNDKKQLAALLQKMRTASVS